MHRRRKGRDLSCRLRCPPMLKNLIIMAHNAAGAGPPSASSNEVIPLSNLPFLVPSASGWSLIALAVGMAIAAVVLRCRQSIATK